MKNNTTKSDSVTAEVWQQVAANKNITVNNVNYTGLFQDNWFGKAEVFLKEGKLWFKCIRSPKLNGQLQMYTGNVFAVKWEYQDMPCDALITFDIDNKGKAQTIKIKGIAPDIDFSFDFQDLDFHRLEI